MVANSAETKSAAAENEDDPQETPWVAPEESPLTVVAHRLRMRYKAPRTDRTPRKGLVARLLPRRQMVSVPAVRGVDLTVREGEFVGIIGRNGSGKSTLLRMLAGVEPPTSGLVLTSSRPQLLGVSAALIPDLTGAENIKLGFLALGMTQQEIDDRFEEAAELSALGDALDLPMRTYSSGMGARLKFAISVMAEPKILMIDEALSTGDATFAERSKRKMDDLLERAGTVFMVNHAPRTIENVCSRVIWMEKGRIVLDGDTKEVSSRYRSFAYRLAKDREDEAMRILRDAVLEGEAQRQASRLMLPDPVTEPEKKDLPDYEPDPFQKIFTENYEKKSFPSTVFPTAHDRSTDTHP
ncbi:teichoic acid transport system ATP-binding protein [Brachybacterium muris]|uniref:ABC transporter ATP-binding protein n=1 Tax=Brachybacterium muris TaxID=219301 RepID=UPI0019571002|nr:ABC transporter ATP-binding protein [Brachybacterium muris]MBM7502083.1 teichoic acid transport system ATP-binding protein [Brachybacterium muris]